MLLKNKKNFVKPFYIKIVVHNSLILIKRNFVKWANNKKLTSIALFQLIVLFFFSIPKGYFINTYIFCFDLCIPNPPPPLPPSVHLRLPSFTQRDKKGSLKRLPTQELITPEGDPSVKFLPELEIVLTVKK